MKADSDAGCDPAPGADRAHAGGRPPRRWSPGVAMAIPQAGGSWSPREEDDQPDRCCQTADLFTVPCAGPHGAEPAEITPPRPVLHCPAAARAVAWTARHVEAIPETPARIVPRNRGKAATGTGPSVLSPSFPWPARGWRSFLASNTATGAPTVAGRAEQSWPHAVPNREDEDNLSRTLAEMNSRSPRNALTQALTSLGLGREQGPIPTEKFTPSSYACT